MTILRTAVKPPMAAKPGASTVQISDFRITRRGRFWQVFDGQNHLIVTAVYRKGALEVVRRLLPPDLRPLVDACPKRSASRTLRVRQAAHPYDPRQR